LPEPSPPEAAQAVQHLFRAELAVRGERGTLRLTLRRWRADRFDLTARDLAGRSLWRLEVDGGRGRLDGSERADRCRFDPTVPLELPRLELPLAAEVLPDLLLGRLPKPELESAELSLQREERGFRLESADGQLVVRWRESARAALGVAPPSLEVDPALPDCRELELS
jgi:hypothetical protein